MPDQERFLPDYEETLRRVGVTLDGIKRARHEQQLLEPPSLPDSQRILTQSHQALAQWKVSARERDAETNAKLRRLADLIDENIRDK